MRTPESSTPRRVEREREILDAAAKLFRERGYASTTIRDIGAAAQLNHASSHYYFGSKSAILYAIYQEALDGFLDRLASIPDGDPRDTLAAVVRASVVESARRPDHTAVFFQERAWLEMHLPRESCVAIRGRQDTFRNRVTAIVEDGVRRGRFRAIEPMVAVEMIIGIATWAYRHRPDDPANLEQAARDCAELMCNGICPD